jgi:hypothetical protein
MTRHRITLDELPLFACDADLAVALLGTTKRVEWEAMFAVLERQGLPPIDPQMGGRYVPAVRAYFDQRYGLRNGPGPLRPDGEETWDDQ